MRSIITRFSINDARGGSVTQDIEFLEVEEARQLLFASTMKDHRQLRDIPHHEFPLDLFNIHPSLLTNVLYGENGSGKTTYLKLMQDAGGFIQSVFNIADNRAKASGEDLIDWHNGRIPKAYQNPSKPALLKFEDLNQNLVYQSIQSTMREPKINKNLAKALNFKMPLDSSFSLEMEGVFAQPGELPSNHSRDMKFTCRIEPTSGLGWTQNDRLMGVGNFHGAYYVVHLRLDAFEDDYNAEIAKSPDNALLDIIKEEGTYHPYWAEYNIPVLIHQSEGVLPLGRTVINPDLEVSKEFRYNDDHGHMDSFVDRWIDEEQTVKNQKFSLFYNLVVGEAMGDLKHDSSGYLVDDGGLNSNPGCEFSCHADVYLMEGYPCDFFLSPIPIKISYNKTSENTLILPSLSQEADYELWCSIQEGETINHFDKENPYGTVRAHFGFVLSGNYPLIRELVKTFKSVYSFSPDYTPQLLVVEVPKPSRFSDRFVNDDTQKYLHLQYILAPPETAIDGLVDSIALNKNIPGNLAQQLETLVEIYDHLEYDMLWPWGEAESMFEKGMEFYTEKYTELGYDEAMREGAARAEIRNFIVEQLDYLWFEGMPKAVANRKPELMNDLLEKHLALTVVKPAGVGPKIGSPACGKIKFSPQNIWGLKSKQKIKFEHLSSGQRNLFSLISMLGSEGDGPILIDEPELSLHMDWQLAMKDIVQSLVNHSKRQVFIASHSPDVILKFDERSFPLLGEEVSDIDA